MGSDQILASKRSLPFMFGNVFLPPTDPWEEANGLGIGSVSSTSEGEVLLRLSELLSDGEQGSNGSNRTGGGDESGDELRGNATSVNRRCVWDRKVDGGIMNSSAGGEDSGEVFRSMLERFATFDRGVLKLVSTTI